MALLPLSNLHIGLHIRPNMFALRTNFGGVAKQNVDVSIEAMLPAIKYEPHYVQGTLYTVCTTHYTGRARERTIGCQTMSKGSCRKSKTSGQSVVKMMCNAADTYHRSHLLVKITEKKDRQNLHSLFAMRILC